MLAIILKLISVFGVVPWLERFLNIGFDNKILQQLTKALTNVTGLSDSDQAVKLIQNNRSLELELQRALLIAEVRYWEQCIKDRENARERDLIIQRIRGQNIRANIMLVMAMMGMMFTFAGLIIFKSALNSEGIGLLSALAAVFGSCLKDVYSFEFGSSKALLHDNLRSFSNDMKK